MPRVKRSVHARKKRRKVLEQAKGYWGLKKSQLHATRRSRSSTRSSTPTATARRRSGRSGGSGSSGSTRPRGRTGSRTTSSSPAAQGRDRARPQGARRPRRQRSRRVRRIAEQAKAALETARQPDRSARREVFLAQAAHCDGRSPLYARALPRASRTSRASPRVVGELPLGHAAAACSAGCTTSSSPGEADVGRRSTRALAAAATCRAFAASRGCRRTRCSARWVLLPCFLEIARRDGADVLDLSSSARARGSTSSGTATATGTRPARGAARRAARARRRGAAPVPADAARAAPARARPRRHRPRPARRHDRRGSAPAALVRLARTRRDGWSGSTARSRRCARDPPELVRGDFVDVLPALLAGRAARRAHARLPDGRARATSADERLARASREALAAAGRDGGLAFV